METAKAVRDAIVHLPPHLKRRVKAAFRAIAGDPHQAKPLKDELTGLRSYRVGRNRLVLRIKDFVIEIIAFGPRRNIYERAAAELSISLRAKDENDEKG